MEFREKGKTLLSSIFSKEKNVTVIEKNVFENCQNDEELYLKLMHEVSTLFLNKTMKLPQILKAIKENKLLWNNDFFETYRKSLIEQDNFIISPFEIDEGVLECNKCNSKKTFSYTKQTRAGDESTTVFAVCANCGAKWKI